MSTRRIDQTDRRILPEPDRPRTETERPRAKWGCRSISLRPGRLPGCCGRGCGRGWGRGCLVRRVVPQPVSANHLLKHRRRGSCGSTTIRPLNNARTWLSSIIFSSRITQECNVASPLTTGSVYYALSNIWKQMKLVLRCREMATTK